MFDIDVVDLPEMAEASEAMLVSAITGWARAEAAASARRLAAIAELADRRSGRGAHADRWSCDGWDVTIAEVAGALTVSHGMAAGQMRLAGTLRARLPRVAALFADGLVSARLVAMIAWRTVLVHDAETLAQIDRALAAEVVRFGPLSVAKATEAVDAIVDYYDPGALRRTRNEARGRDVVIDTDKGICDGISEVWGALYTTDATVLDRRLNQLAHGVCDSDPRTVAQRRADALGVLAAGGDHLVCGCGQPDCPAAGERPATSGVVIHVVADKESLATAADPELGGEPGAAPVTSELRRPPAASPTLLIGGGVMPNPLLAELLRNGAKVRTVRHPGDAPPESAYRPSAALAEFIRCRDLTCRFPGCDRPADGCDIDHTVAYADGGPTCASNLKLLCRKHHLLKTFWTGWRDQQLADGTVIWTAPTGHIHITRPGSHLLFPALCRPTATAALRATTKPPSPGRTLMMPTRGCTRAQSRDRRIRAERALNADHVAERNRPPPF